MLGPFRWPALLVLAAVGTAVAGTGAAQQPVAVLRVAYVGQPTSPIHAGAAYLKETLEMAAAGRVEVQLAPAGPQWDEEAILADLRRGAVHLAILGGRIQAAPATQLTSLPFLFRDPAHRRRFAEDAGGRLLAKRIADQSGLSVLGFFASPEHVVATAAGPVARPADLRGMAFRVEPQPVLVTSLRALGVSPFPLPAPVMLGAVGQRMVTGSHLELQTALGLNLYEFLPFMSDSATPFLAGLQVVFADRRVLSALPADLRASLVEAVGRAARRQMDLAEEARLRLQRDLEGRGVKFTPLDSAAFQEAMRPAWEKAARVIKAEDVLRAIVRAQ